MMLVLSTPSFLDASSVIRASCVMPRYRLMSAMLLELDHQPKRAPTTLIARQRGPDNRIMGELVYAGDEESYEGRGTGDRGNRDRETTRMRHLGRALCRKCSRMHPERGLPAAPPSGAARSPLAARPGAVRASLPARPRTGFPIAVHRATPGRTPVPATSAPTRQSSRSRPVR